MPGAWLVAALLAAAEPADLAPITCDACPGWNEPQAPFRIHGNVHYVGVRGLSAVLVTTKRGSILIDGALPQSAPLIAANIRALGHRIEDVKWIVISHAHYDHVGGIAALARMSGARVAASPLAAKVLRAGVVASDDPQAGPEESRRFPPVARVATLADRATIALGEVTLTAHHTPGHTAGGTSWSWRSCEGDRCLDVVYADSLTPVSSPGFRFGADPARVRRFRASIARVGGLPCDILLAPHPNFVRLFKKQEARARDATVNPFIDPTACRTYAAEATTRLDTRLAEETTHPLPKP